MIKKKSSSIKAVILSIAIALISVFFFAYAIQSVYPAPEYENFCDIKPVKVNLNDETSCIEANGKWVDYERDSLDMEIRGYCDRDFACRGEYEDIRDVYERNVFFANLIIGISIFVIGFFLAIEAVSGGLMGGGLILMFYGTIRYWGNLSDIWRTLLLGFSLVVLIWLGYKKLNK